jgi:hypothetical protein
MLEPRNQAWSRRNLRRQNAIRKRGRSPGPVDSVRLRRVRGQTESEACGMPLVRYAPRILSAPGLSRPSLWDSLSASTQKIYLEKVKSQVT